LILTDYADSATRILQVIRMLDNNFLDPDLVELVKVTNNVPSDIIDDLKKFYGSGTNTVTGVTFAALDRLNAILVMASSKRALSDTKYWIDKLDASSARTIQTHFYTVQNSTASNIAMMLAALFSDNSNNAQGRANAGTVGGGGLATTGQTRTGTGSSGVFGNQAGGVSTGIGGSSGFGGSGGFGNNAGFGNSMGGNTGRTGTSTGSLGPTLSVNPTISSITLTGGSFTGLQDAVRMVVDDINNNLVIQSTAADYAYVYEIIKKMDLLPRQVLVDARVFEVLLNNDLQYGINPIFEPNGSTTSPGGATVSDALRSTYAEINGAAGLVAGTFLRVGNTREILMKLSALRSKTKIKVLESPSVLALDGSTASINVGQEIPYPTGTTIGNTVSQSNISYRQTGVTLMVYPRVSASGFVNMTITQEVSSQGAPIDVGGTKATTFNVTTVSSTFTVKDGETVAIAGLIREQKDNSRQGIPVLSDIPLLGSLFSTTSKSQSRTELVVLITPHVIRTVDRLSEMTQELKDLLPNVRRAIDEYELERIQEMENARKERYGQEQKEMKRAKPVNKPTSVEEPETSEQSEEQKKTDAPPKIEEPLKPEEPKKLESPPKTEAPIKQAEPQKPS
jgi:general secretion pathway protein D